jgi:hypothetical protein
VTASKEQKQISMVKFIHTADWQIGMKAAHVGAVGSRVNDLNRQNVLSKSPQIDRSISSSLLATHLRITPSIEY